MASYNRIILLGNLTRDPQLSYTPSNTPVCKFGLAVNHRWKDREGGTREEVCFVDCTVFGRAAETFNQYMSKGQGALVEGRLQLNQWTTPEGEKKSKHEVLVDNFTFVGGRRGGEPGGEAAGGYGTGTGTGRAAGNEGGEYAPARSGAGPVTTPPNPDDVPF